MWFLDLFSLKTPLFGGLKGLKALIHFCLDAVSEPKYAKRTTSFNLIRVCSSVWQQSGRCVGHDTFTDKSNRKLFFNLKTTEGILSLKSSLFPNLQGHHYLKGHSQLRFSPGGKYSSSPRNPWAMGPPALRASWREPRRTGERAPSVNDKRSVSDCEIRGHSARDNYSRAAVMDLLSQPTPTCNPMHSMVFTATSKYVANDHGGNTTKQKEQTLWTLMIFDQGVSTCRVVKRVQVPHHLLHGWMDNDGFTDVVQQSSRFTQHHITVRRSTTTPYHAKVVILRCCG